MDRFQSEPYPSSTKRHFRNEEEAIEYDARQAVEAAVLSDCCAAEIRCEMRAYTTCPDTGYREGGPTDVCSACGDETEPMLQPVAQLLPLAIPVPLMRDATVLAVSPKPIKMQGELFIQEVA
jgi:hypothetical protein